MSLYYNADDSICWFTHSHLKL